MPTGTEPPPCSSRLIRFLEKTLSIRHCQRSVPARRWRHLDVRNCLLVWPYRPTKTLLLKAPKSGRELKEMPIARSEEQPRIRPRGMNRHPHIRN